MTPSQIHPAWLDPSLILACLHLPALWNGEGVSEVTGFGATGNWAPPAPPCGVDGVLAPAEAALLWKVLVAQAADGYLPLPFSTPFNRPLERPLQEEERKPQPRPQRAGSSQTQVTNRRPG